MSQDSFTLDDIAALPPKLAELMFGMVVHRVDGRIDAAPREPSRTVALMGHKTSMSGGHWLWPRTMTPEEIAASRIQRSIFVADDVLSPEPRRARTALGYGLLLEKGERT